MQDISSLFTRYLNNESSDEEIKTLLKCFGQKDMATDLKDLILKELKQEPPVHFEEGALALKIFTQTDQGLNKKLFLQTNKRSYFSHSIFKYVIAACIFCVLTFTFLQYVKQDGSAQKLNDVNPGTDKAILTLADGSIVTLSSKSGDAILRDKGVKIKKTKDGILVYEVSGNQSNSEIAGQNILSTPNGAKFEVLLSDGTKVWLNAGSSLRYPLRFSQHERKVELTGEAYFEVEKVVVNHKRVPFYVETPRQVIQVLGTEFNISAYHDDNKARTTLLSGTVDVSDHVNGDHVILLPGDQAVSQNGSTLQVIKVNAKNSMAWKEGDFNFEDMYLKDILKELSRWYDVQVDYKSLPQTRYNIFISREEKLSAFLRMLEKTGNIKFQFTNNIIKALPM